MQTVKLLSNTFLFLFLPLLAWTQTATQTVKGTIIDQQSEMPLIGATVEWLNAEKTVGTTTDLDGYFRLENIPVGRQEFRVSYIGYASINVPNVVVTAGKEVILNIGLQESISELTEVVVTAAVEKDQPQNEMAAISARTFSLEEVNRFSGGRNDVARLAGNFAGVSTADDSRNDIVIRGNSPTGLLWQLEGIPIPNPNHFSTLGTTGGPVSALNPNLLRNSDFLTSAFPAEYGNAVSGVFDLGFKSGNKDRYEFTGQLGMFSGLEFMAEGPISKKDGSSFIASYRHSFVELADVVGIPVGTNAVPNYRDLAFKLDFGNSKLGKFALFGIGGVSSIDFLGEEVDENDLFADPNQDAYVRSRFGVAGLRHNLILGKQSYLRTVIAASSSVNLYDEEDFLEDGEKYEATDVDDITNRYSISSYINSKLSKRFTLRTGILTEVYDLSTKVLDRNGQPDADEDGLPDLATIRDFDGNFTLLQAYSQGQYKITESLTLNAGLHAQYLAFNESFALEPRAALAWSLAPRHTITLGYGLHNQMQPLPVFLFNEEVAPGIFEATNESLDFTRSNHYVLGYDWKFAKDWRLKLETYYQDIDQVPVDPTPSSFSILNAGADFVFPQIGSLVNEGTGYNTGVEMTLEKFFSQGFYTLVTASLFDSKYTGSDGIERNTAFNNQYVLNVLAGKEFKIGAEKRHAITFDTKLTTAGGRYYTPVDLELSRQFGMEILDESRAFSERFDPYFRWDVKVGFTLNSKTRKLSQQFFLDLQNVTFQENVFQIRYNELTNEVNTVYQAGFFPDLMYRVQF